MLLLHASLLAFHAPLHSRPAVHAPLHSRPAAHAPLHSRRPSFVARSGRVAAYVGGDDILWTKTESGLSYKETSLGGDVPKHDDVISIAFETKFLGDERVLEKVRRERPLTFSLEDAEYSLFKEAVAGMGVGGKRRVLLPPSAASFSKETKTIAFELELVEVKSGVGGALIKFDTKVGGLRNWARAAFFLSFVPDVFRLVSYLANPPTEAAAQAMAQASDAAAAAAAHPAVVDAANRWAADGLANLF